MEKPAGNPVIELRQLSFAILGLLTRLAILVSRVWSCLRPESNSRVGLGVGKRGGGEAMQRVIMPTTPELLATTCNHEVVAAHL